MKKLLLLAAMTLVTSLAFSQEIPRGAVRLGERAVDFHADHDMIPVGAYDGWFRSIVLAVEKNNIELFNVVITYADGQREKVDTRLIFDEHSRSRIIRLEGGKRRIRDIAFTYRTVGSWLEGRARVVVYGIR